jgi:putative SOS response-associated peptidase YedK
MCGRFTNELTWSELHALYKLSNELHPVPKSNLQPRYNIAPTQDVDFVHLDRAGNRELNQGRWWLVPFFAKEVL